MDVKTAGRTVEIFELFAQAKEPLSLSEIARGLDAPMSSCLYIVRALESRGYMYATGFRKHVYPTRKLLELGTAIVSGESWVARLVPLLTELRDTTKETVILGKRQGAKVLYLMVIEGTQTIRYSSRAGELKPYHASAIGKALLGSMDKAERAKLTGKIAFDATTESTLTSRDLLLEDVEEGTRRGYYRTRGENVADVMAVACPIKVGSDYYAVALAGPLQRLAQEEAAQVEHLKAFCQAVEVLEGFG